MGVIPFSNFLPDLQLLLLLPGNLPLIMQFQMLLIYLNQKSTSSICFVSEVLQPFIHRPVSQRRGNYSRYNYQLQKIFTNQLHNAANTCTEHFSDADFFSLYLRRISG